MNRRRDHARTSHLGRLLASIAPALTRFVPVWLAVLAVTLGLA